MPNILVRAFLPFARFFANPSLMFFALPWLMVLLVLGTVAQRYIGLYASQKLFFGSFVLWAGWVPLPGAYITVTVIAVSLIAKLAFKSEISVRRTGTLLVHVSAVVLLLGGLISALMREEGYVVLGDGESAQSVSDYRQRELSVTANGSLVKFAPLVDLRAGKSYSYYALPFNIRVLNICFPCDLRRRTVPAANLRGAAEKFELASTMYSKEDVRNLTGVEIAIDGSGPGDGIYILYEGFTPERIITGPARYDIALKPLQRPLPFNVRLLHFTKSDYPGTDEARAYRSDVAVKDGALEWKTAIEMNQPLRYKGYTLYQSSYVTDDNKIMSVLAVVKNAGEWFPYIAIALLCAGLMLHIIIMRIS